MQQAIAMMASNPGDARALVNQARTSDGFADLSQAGLKVERRKRQLPVIVIDRIETSPID